MTHAEQKKIPPSSEPLQATNYPVRALTARKPQAEAEYFMIDVIFVLAITEIGEARRSSDENC